MDELIQGKKKWKIIKKLAEGDAGVIYSVSAYDKKGKVVRAIQKSPQSNPLAAERQASQISQEGIVLEKIRDFTVNYKNKFSAKPVEFIDKNINARNKEEVFIVIERAMGWSLKQMSSIAQEGFDKENFKEQKYLSPFLKNIAATKKIPELIILRALYIVLEFIDQIHRYSFDDINGKKVSGVIWNDVKPDHIFWSPENKLFTIIDFGNCQLLEENGLSRDGKYDTGIDFLQYFDSMGAFLRQSSPNLYRQLNWTSLSIDINDETISVFKERLSKELLIAEAKAEALLERQNQESKNSPQTINELLDLINTILGVGEWPEYLNAEKIALQFLLNYTSGTLEFDKNECLEICLSVKNFPVDLSVSWDLLTKLIRLAENESVFVIKAINAVIEKNENWKEETLWILKEDSKSNSNREEWADVFFSLREMSNINREIRTPLSILRDIKKYLEQKPNSNSETWNINIQNFLELLDQWSKKELTSLNSPFMYLEARECLEKILNEDRNLQDLSNEYFKSVSLAENASEGFWESWCNKNFPRSEKFLKRLLMFDPDCLRVYLFQDCVKRAPLWLEKVEKHLPALIWGGSRDLIAQGKYFTNLLGENRRVYDENARADWLYDALDSLSGKKKTKVLADPALVIRDDSLLKSLEEYYSHIKNVRWNNALEVIENAMMGDIELDFYRQVIKNVRGVIEGSPITDIPEASPVQKDTIYKPLRKILYLVVDWYKALRKDGIPAAEKKYTDTLKQNLPEWKFLQSIEERQAELDECLNLFNRLTEKNWNGALNALRSSAFKGLGEFKGSINIFLNKLIDSRKIIFSKSKFNFDLFSKELSDLSDSGESVITAIKNKLEVSNKNIVWQAAHWHHVYLEIEGLQKYLLNASKSAKTYLSAKKRNDKVSRGKEFLDNVVVLESMLLGESTQSGRWRKSFDEIVHNKKSPLEAGLELSHPFYEFLLIFNDVQPVINWHYILSALIVIVVAISGLSTVKYFVSSVSPNETTIVEGTEFVETTVGALDETEEPINPPAQVATSTPTQPIVEQQPATPISECDLVRIYVQDKKWNEYNNFLDENSGNYDALMDKCGWKQDFQARKTTLKLMEALQLSMSGEKGKARGVVEALFEELGATNVEYKLIPKGENIEPFINDLRIYTALCNGLPNGYIDELDKSRFLAFLQVKEVDRPRHQQLESTIFSKDLDPDLFNLVCHSSAGYFSDTQVIEQKKPINLLVTDSYPMIDINGNRNCIYYDRGAEYSNFHYYPVESDLECLMEQSLLHTDSPVTYGDISFLNVGMCAILEPEQRIQDYSYSFFIKQQGLLSSQENEAASFTFKNKDVKLYLPSANNFEVPGNKWFKQYECRKTGDAGVHISMRRIGNLLLWGYSIGDEPSMEYYVGGILNDEYMNFPVTMGFNGSIQQGLQLHLIILNLEMGLEGDN